MQFLELDFPVDAKRVWDLYVPIIKSKNKITVFITEDIAEPSAYNELIYWLQSASSKDKITLYLNTDGGDLDSTISIINAIKNSKATITAHLSGTVASAGTMIALSCDNIVVDDYTKFMVHTYSTGITGKGNEVKARQDFMDLSINKLLKKVYNKFLTNEELCSLLEGKDYWFDKKEIIKRWKRCK